jgi:hypothetical protein
MNTLELADGCIVIGNKQSDMVGTIDPIADGFWVSVGRPNENGVIIGSENWDSFVQLIKDVDTYLKEYYENSNN